MTTLRKIITGDMRKAAEPELPGHLRHAIDAANTAIEKAVTPTEKAMAQHQAEQARGALQKHIGDINFAAEIKKAHLKPRHLFERF